MSLRIGAIQSRGFSGNSKITTKYRVSFGGDENVLKLDRDNGEVI